MKVCNFIREIITDSGKQSEGKTNYDRELSIVATQKLTRKAEHDQANASPKRYARRPPLCLQLELNHIPRQLEVNTVLCGHLFWIYVLQVAPFFPVLLYRR